MMTIFRYELRRLIWNKSYLGLVVIAGLYSYQFLGGDIIRGVAYTAPFSAWSYGAYLSSVLPILLITLLFFLTFLYSGTEKKVQAITGATPVDPRAYQAVRYAAMLVGFLLISVVVVLISFVFYSRLFGFTAFGDFVVPIVLTLIPAMLVTFGLGILAGMVHVGLLYALMLVLLVFSQVSLPPALDVLGGSFYRSYPLTLPAGPAGEPAFQLPAGILATRIGLSVAGAALIGLMLGRPPRSAALSAGRRDSQKTR